MNSIEKQTEILTHVTHVNGWAPAVYMSYMSQNFRLFLVLTIRSKLSNFSAHVSWNTQTRMATTGVGHWLCYSVLDGMFCGARFFILHVHFFFCRVTAAGP